MLSCCVVIFPQPTDTSVHRGVVVVNLGLNILHTQYMLLLDAGHS